MSELPDITLSDMLILLARFQGLILAVVYFTKKKQHPANFFLSFFLFSIAIYDLSFYYVTLDIESGQEIERILVHRHHTSLVIGPLFYFYVKKLTLPSWSFSHKNLTHFIPFSILEVINIVHVFLFYSTNISAIQLSRINDVFDAAMFGMNILGRITPFFYFFFTITLVSSYQKFIADNYSDHEGITLKWLRQFLFVMSTLWLIWLFSTVYAFFFEEHVSKNFYTPLYVFFLFSMYWIGIKAFNIKPIDDFQKYDEPEKTSFSREEKELLINTVKTRKLYLITGIKLQDLSKETTIPAHRISLILNQGLNQNFYEFINSFRLEIAKELLENSNNQHLTLDAIAYDCGFNSRSVFYDTFKRFYKLTPKEYRSKFVS